MKKSFFMLGMALVALTSCSESEVLETVDDSRQTSAIDFGTWVGNVTRADDTENPELTALKAGNSAGFYVHGKYVSDVAKAEENEVFDGKSESSHVFWSETATAEGTVGSWGYSPINYWSANSTYKFAAYAPKLPSGTTSSFDYNTNKLTITNFVANGTDNLLVAATGALDSDNYITAKDAKETQPEVKFNFKHALSKVTFTFKNGWRNNVTMTLGDITLKGVNNTGTLTTPELLQSVAGVGANDWVLTDATGSYKYTDASTTPVNIMSMAVYGEQKTFVCYLLPQTLSRETGNEIKLSFSVTVLNENKGGPDLDGKGGHTTTLEIPLPVTTVTEWVPSMAYNYVVEISGSTFGLNPIQFKVESVEDWGTKEDIDIFGKANAPAYTE